MSVLKHYNLVLFYLIIYTYLVKSIEHDPSKCEITGPGIIPNHIVLPARYFFIKSTERYQFSENLISNQFYINMNVRCNVSQTELHVELKGVSEYGPCRVWTQVLDRHDGSFIVRYKMFQNCDDLEIHVTWKDHHLAESPYIYKGRVYADACDCPLDSIDKLITQYKCPENLQQIDRDLSQFPDDIDFSNDVLAEAHKRFNHPGSQCFCHYVIKNNKVQKQSKILKQL